MRRRAVGLLADARRRPEWPPVAGRQLEFRYARQSDLPALHSLARAARQDVPSRPLLLASLGAEIWAAMSLDGSSCLAHPFRPTGELVWSLADLTRQERSRGPGPETASEVLLPECPRPDWFT